MRVYMMYEKFKFLIFISILNNSLICSSRRVSTVFLLESISRDNGESHNFIANHNRHIIGTNIDINYAIDQYKKDGSFIERDIESQTWNVMKKDFIEKIPIDQQDPAFEFYLDSTFEPFKHKDLWYSVYDEEIGKFSTEFEAIAYQERGKIYTNESSVMYNLLFGKKYWKSNHSGKSYSFSNQKAAEQYKATGRFKPYDYKSYFFRRSYWCSVYDGVIIDSLVDIAENKKMFLEARNIAERYSKDGSFILRKDDHYIVSFKNKQPQVIYILDKAIDYYNTGKFDMYKHLELFYSVHERIIKGHKMQLLCELYQDWGIYYDTLSHTLYIKLEDNYDRFICFYEKPSIDLIEKNFICYKESDKLVLNITKTKFKRCTLNLDESYAPRSAIGGHDGKIGSKMIYKPDGIITYTLTKPIPQENTAVSQAKTSLKTYCL